MQKARGNLLYPPLCRRSLHDYFDDGKLTEIRDILMGELWLCSGQSNMEMPMKGFKNQPVENSNTDVMNSRNPQLRLFTVKRASSFTPKQMW